MAETFITLSIHETELDLKQAEYSRSNHTRILCSLQPTKDVKWQITVTQLFIFAHIFQISKFFQHDDLDHVWLNIISHHHPLTVWCRSYVFARRHSCDLITFLSHYWGNSNWGSSPSVCVCVFEEDWLVKTFFLKVSYMKFLKNLDYALVRVLKAQEIPREYEWQEKGRCKLKYLCCSVILKTYPSVRPK